MAKRVVITGMGIVSPAGCDVNESWRTLVEGKSCVSKITRFDTSEFEIKIGAEVKNFDPLKYLEKKEANNLDRFTQLGMASAIQCINDSQLDFSKLDRTRIGAIIGSGIGGMAEIEEQHRRLFEKGPSRVSPFFIPKLMMNSLPGYVSIKYGLMGPNHAVASACASANHAMGIAFNLLRQDALDIVITGGSEAACTRSSLAGFQALKALSKRNDEPEKACRPFDLERDGFVLGEGAACFVFETLESASKRNAKIFAEVLGFGMSADAYHITAPDPEGYGAYLSMESALEDANLKPEQIDYINAHGTSTPLNDKTETLAIKRLFGEKAYSIPISSTKSMIGHLLGAAGAVELFATVMSINTGIIHPTINYENPDPECDLYYVPNKSISKPVNYALSNSFGFGGHNATIVIGKFIQ